MSTILSLHHLHPVPQLLPARQAGAGQEADMPSIHTNKKQSAYLDTLDKGGIIRYWLEFLPQSGNKVGS